MQSAATEQQLELPYADREMVYAKLRMLAYFTERSLRDNQPYPARCYSEAAFSLVQRIRRGGDVEPAR